MSNMNRKQRRLNTNNPGPHRAWIPEILSKATSRALALAIVLGVGAVATPSAGAQTFSVLYNFAGSDGSFPQAGLVRDATGNLYGTTEGGGASGYGVVFKVDTSGTEAVLHSFTGGKDGEYPVAELIRDTAGNLYGTTSGGGAHGLGTVFKLDTAGTETVLYSFAGGTTDGCDPYAGLLQDKVGNLYGTTYSCGASGVGTVFNVSKTGKETVLHSFAGYPTDGANPYLASLLMDMKGSLYGVTEYGGPSAVGVVYKLRKTGRWTVLHRFTAGVDGYYPAGTLAMDTHKNLYGTTQGCGHYCYGTVWKLSKNGTETVLHNFVSDGDNPRAGVIMDAKGNFYGDTEFGGNSYHGVVYELDTKGVLTVLHNFVGWDGLYPIGGVIRDAKGNLYGTTSYGGSGTKCQSGCGTVWQITR